MKANIKVVFQGEVEVHIPKDIPFPNEIAKFWVLSRLLATLDNPDPPDEDAFDDYLDMIPISEEDEITRELLGAKWDLLTGQMRGTWHVE